MNGVRIRYELREHGWATMQLKIGAAELDIGSFGDCTDALGDLVRLALAICSGEYRASVSLDGEPFEWRIVLQRGHIPQERETLTVEVRGFADIYDRTPDEAGDLLLSARCEADEFGRAVAEAAEAVLVQHGAEGYAQRWRLEAFPLRALTALKAALATVEPPSPRLRQDGSLVMVARNDG